MSKTFISIIYFVVVAFLAMASRWLPHPPNFTAVSGFFFVGGYLASRNIWFALASFIPLVISDLLLGDYPGLLFVYAGHAAVLLFGWYFGASYSESRKARQILPFSVLSLSSAMIFFVLSNLGVWWSSGIYPRTSAGLAECFLMALPFFHQTLIAQVMFSVIFVASYKWVEARAEVAAEKSV